MLTCQSTSQPLLHGKLSVMLPLHENLVYVVLRLEAISMVNLNSQIAVDNPVLLNLEASCTT